jgi:hypothetical protein
MKMNLSSMWKRALYFVLALLLAPSLITGGMLSAVLADDGPPTPPHRFYGTVTCAGQPVVGATVRAYVDGNPAESTTTDSEGRYGYDPVFLVTGTTGQEVTFTVGGVPAAESATYQSGGLTNLDLTIAGTPPTVTTGTATSVTQTSATLNGNLTNLGTASSVQVYFEWGTSTSYGNTTTPQTKTSTGSFSATVSGLNCGTTYHFRAVASGDGTATGSDATFTTLACDGGGGGALEITTTCPLPGGRLNQPYSVTLQATGGTPPYTWSLASGSLPRGLTLSSNGVISGTPTATGLFPFTITVTDSASPKASKTKTCSIEVTIGPPKPAHQAPEVTIVIKWGESQGATKYWLQVSTSASFAAGYDVFNQEVGNVTSYELALPEGEKGTFYWRVKAGDAQSWGDWSKRHKIYWK